LNLVGSCAAENCVNAVSLFGFIHALYNFLSSLTNRWKLLTYSLRGVVPNSLSGTRWSARSDATRALKENYESIYSVLKSIATNNETSQARSDDSALANKREKHEFAILSTMWNTILDRFNATNKTTFWLGSLKGGGLWEDLRVDGRITLR
jgi:hypothetical protein